MSGSTPPADTGLAVSPQTELCERAVSATLGRMLDMVKFAEAKNAAAVSFCTAWVWAEFNVLTATRPPPLGYAYCLPWSLGLFFVAAVIALASFIPRTDLAWGAPHHTREPNLVYFGDIRRATRDSYKRSFRAAYLHESGKSFEERLVDDLLDQARINACLAQRKFGFFNLAAYLILMGLGILTVPPIIWVIGAAHSAHL